MTNRTKNQSDASELHKIFCSIGVSVTGAIISIHMSSYPGINAPGSIEQASHGEPARFLDLDATLWSVCNRAQCVHLAVAIERVKASTTLTFLRCSIIHRRKERIDRKVQWACDWVGGIIDLCSDRAG